MKKRILSALLAVTVVSAMVVGCGSNSSSDSKDDKKEATEDKKELTYGSSYGVYTPLFEDAVMPILEDQGYSFEKVM